MIASRTFQLADQLAQVIDIYAGLCHAVSDGFTHLIGPEGTANRGIPKYVSAVYAPLVGIAAITRSRLKNRSTDYYQNWYIQTAGFPNGVSIFMVCAPPARKPHWFKSS
ncbi:hypothetical protein [Bradyrhizobium sp. sBnM-33]|uniref:hypothetical protein n=1 Tax=Bradyrhizobium sp. sBnM-33 TaxID=2831780 RepID=UPI001BCFF908|nr:hypothetical protein [Bradyrhizobium sp. sBnM-33]WOH47628.1 hypothetical protein RX328_26040 [Bradyrhizobium sp. sBnM-33]